MTFITELLVKYLHILNTAVDKELSLCAFIFGMFIKNFSPALKENNADAFSPYFITSKGCEAVFKFLQKTFRSLQNGDDSASSNVLSCGCNSFLNKQNSWILLVFCVTSCVTVIVLKNFGGAVIKFYL